MAWWAPWRGVGPIYTERSVNTGGMTVASRGYAFSSAGLQIGERGGQVLQDAAQRGGVASGAGHDAMHIAKLCPTGMIFVPCEKGVSHNESENASAADLAAGTRTLAATLVELANR